MGEDKALQKVLKKKERKEKEATAAAMVVEQAEQKQSKKKKREEPVAAAAAVEPVGWDEAEAEAKRARKKAKKEAKRLAKLQQGQGQEQQNGHAANGDGNGHATAEEGEEEQEGVGLSKEEKKRLKKEKKAKKAGAANGGSSCCGGSNGQAASTSSTLSPEEVQRWWEEHEIMVSGKGCETIFPVLRFQDAGFPADLLECTKGFQTPTPIQSQCWPVLMGGRDIIGIAETGSGKTLTFSLPGLCRVREEAATRKKNVTRMLVVAPTRELAMQSQEVLDAVLAAKGLKGAFRSVCLFGGVPKHDQRRALRAGVDVIVATPGRLVDLMEEGECDISQVTYLVLDEADRMLDQGFEQAIRQIIGATAPHPRRQTALLSATWPQAIQALANEFLQDPVKVVIGGEDLSSNKRVTQIVEVVSEFEREKLLRGLLQQYHAKRDNRILVFALYKKEAARLEQNLQRAGYACLGIHGDKSQTDRINAVNQFKSKEIPLLVATDVAARGLDIPDVEVVINYSFPLTIEDYVHRIGRTGRAGKTGVAHTFFHQGDKGNAGALVNTLRQAEQPVPEELLKFGTAVKKKEHKLYGAFGPKGGDVDMHKKPTKIVFGDDD